MVPVMYVDICVPYATYMYRPFASAIFIPYYLSKVVQKLLRGVKFGCFHGSDTHNNIIIIGKPSITNTPIGRTLKLNYKTSRVPVKLHRSNIFQCAHTHTCTRKHVT